MTVEQRNAGILKALDAQNKRNLASPAKARATLISEGIYTPKGNLRVRFGGRGASKAA